MIYSPFDDDVGNSLLMSHVKCSISVGVLLRTFVLSTAFIHMENCFQYHVMTFDNITFYITCTNILILWLVESHLISPRWMKHFIFLSPHESIRTIALLNIHHLYDVLLCFRKLKETYWLHKCLWCNPYSTYHIEEFLYVLVNFILRKTIRSITESTVSNRLFFFNDSRVSARLNQRDYFR